MDVEGVQDQMDDLASGQFKAEVRELSRRSMAHVPFTRACRSIILSIISHIISLEPATRMWGMKAGRVSRSRMMGDAALLLVLTLPWCSGSTKTAAAALMSFIWSK